MMATATMASGPDWADVDEEILCPLCDYNLRGLQTPRCPECGFRFDWRDMLDSTRRQHRYVFEHHPERNAWSFGKTLRSGLRPGKFWRSLHPAQPAHPRRLIGYGLIVSCFALLPVTAFLVLTAIYHFQNTARMRVDYRSWAMQNPSATWSAEEGRLLSVDAWLDKMAPQHDQLEFWIQLFRLPWASQCAMIGLLSVAWPAITYASLLIFRWSMRRAKVKRGHVLRCVIYSYDSMIWAGLVSAAVMTIPIRQSPPWVVGYLRNEIFSLVVGASVLLMTYRLGVAYKVYMRFDHAAATVIATQIIYSLVFVIASVRFYLWF